MTVSQAISFVRMLIDESRYEHFGSSSDLNAVFIEYLQKGAVEKAREFWYRGEKEALRPLWMEQTVAGSPATLSFTPLFIETVRLQNDPSDVNFRHAAAYTPIERFTHAPMLNPSLGSTISGKYEFTHYDGKVYHNGDATAGVRISYVKLPEVSTTLSDPMPMAEYTHGMICERAAALMWTKESDEQDRPMVGGMLDIMGTFLETQKQG